jgi:hypothetical protein
MRDRNHVHPGGRVLAAVLSGLLATSAMAPYAFAQPKGAAAAAEKQKRDTARGHYEAGRTKLDAKDYAGALTEFQAANAIIPSPQAQEKIALCYDGMNDAPNALKAYELFIEQAKDSEKLKAEVEAAKGRIEALKNAPVAVSMVSDPPTAQGEVDGPAQMGAPPLPSPPPPPPAPPPPAATLPPPPAQQDQSANASVQPARSNLPAYITLGVAGASAIVGTVFGVKALSNKSDFNDDPTTENADDAERNALISDMAFGVAVTLGVTGTVLLLSNNAGQEQAAKDARSQKTMQLTPFVGPSGGGAAATWRF